MFPAREVFVHVIFFHGEMVHWKEGHGAKTSMLLYGSNNNVSEYNQGGFFSPPWYNRNIGVIHASECLAIIMIMHRRAAFGSTPPHKWTSRRRTSFKRSQSMIS